ncbi:insulinase family protein [Pasteurella atlantica]|uniref:Insulinase family protein n=3 Tax=Pasteurellales TaxID=135625 RepID=A0ACC6HJI9_9PAST|nr:insulinase family protein [Pasteurella atlantica]MDP8050914.1 insulinase family protein [Pasteurella atlantica]MDP8147570.1 insulinase family protein [Pasteurella atlantica]
MMKKILFICAIFLLNSCGVSHFNPAEKLSFNEQVTKGTLENGLRYYVLKNTLPKDKVYLRLVVNAGSLNEDDDQKGVAHLVEHLAFNGSKKFPKNQIIDILEKLGMKFARDINAFTDFENTVYTLNLAKNNEKNLDLALDVVNEWIHNLTILPEDLDAERGVVLEEWRARLSPMLRLGNKKSLVEMANSRYVKRDPIGDVNIIRHISQQRVYDFYKKWYRPDNMSLIIVGDIDPAQAVNLIKQKLKEKTTAKTPLPKIDYRVPVIEKWRVATVSEKQMNTQSIEFGLFKELRNQDTVAEYKQELLQQIAIRLTNLRLQKWEKTNKNQIESANLYQNYLGRETLEWVFNLQLKNNKIAKNDYLTTASILFNFIAEINQNGFEQAEFDSEVKRIKKLNETEKGIEINSLNLADDLLISAATDQVNLSQQYKYQLNKKLLNEITLNEVNQVIQQWVKLKAKLLLVTQPFKKTSFNFDVKEVEALWEKALGQSQSHWNSNPKKVHTVSFKEQKLALTQGNISMLNHWNDMDIIEYQLENGSKLVYYYSDKNPQKVHFSAITTGGLRSVPEKDYQLLKAATTMVDDTGIGKFSQDYLTKQFGNNPIAFMTVLDDAKQGFTSISKSDNLENILKLFRFRLQASPISEVVLKKYQYDMQSYFADQDKESEFAYQVSKLRYPNRETVYTKKPSHFNSLKSDVLSKLYQKYILNKTDFTYFIVGDIDQKTVEKLAKKYLATVPMVKIDRPLKPLLINSPSKDFILKGLNEPRAEVDIYLTANNRYNPENEYLLDILGDMLQEELRLNLREKASGVYSVTSWFSQAPYSSQIEGKISFSCAPSRVNELKKMSHKILDDFLNNGIDRELFLKKLAEKRNSLKNEYNSLLMVLNMIEESYLVTNSPNLLYRVTRLEHIVTQQKLDQLATKVLKNSVRFNTILTH